VLSQQRRKQTSGSEDTLVFAQTTDTHTRVFENTHTRGANGIHNKRENDGTTMEENKIIIYQGIGRRGHCPTTKRA